MRPLTMSCRNAHRSRETIREKCVDALCLKIGEAGETLHIEEAALAVIYACEASITADLAFRVG